MNCTPLFILILIGLVAGHGAWKRNLEYKYELLARVSVASPKSDIISRAHLYIRPQSNDLLIGQIIQAEYVNQQTSNEIDSDLIDRDQLYSQWPLNKLFKIHLKNGAIQSLSVDPTMTNKQINQLKLIVSQFQADTNATNVIEPISNVLPQEDNTASYKTVEPTVTGNCETQYEISSFPEYLAQSNRDLIPLPNIKEEEQFIQIVKTRNNKNCNELSGHFLNLTSRSEFQHLRSDEQFSLSEITRIIISGTLQNYTIQSSVTKNKVVGISKKISVLYDYVYVGLESVERNSNEKQLESGNLMNVGNLVYSDAYDSDRNESSVQHPDDSWSGCWALFPTGNAVCKDEFGPDWVEVEHEKCGFIGLGKQVLCRYTCCEATACYSVVIQHSTLCGKSFGTRLPVTKGGWEDCFPGFHRSRCCPN